MAAPRCLSCQKALEEGFLQQYGQSYTTSWVAGPQEKSKWGGVKLRKRPRLAVIALRCTSCGLLHLYAPGGPPVA
jgi:hypothetical protein